MDTPCKKFYGNSEAYEIPGNHKIVNLGSENGIYKCKAYDPGRCEINFEIYLTDDIEKYGNCLTKTYFLDIIKANGLTNIERVVNIVSIETHEDYRGQGIATSLLLDFLSGYRTSKTDIIVTHNIPIELNIESTEEEDFWDAFDTANANFEYFFGSFGFHPVPDITEGVVISFTNSYLYVSPKSEASKSLYKLFTRANYGVGTKDE